jgi:hypothetical protein
LLISGIAVGLWAFRKAARRAIAKNPVEINYLIEQLEQLIRQRKPDRLVEKQSRRDETRSLLCDAHAKTEALKALCAIANEDNRQELTTVLASASSDEARAVKISAVTEAQCAGVERQFEEVVQRTLELERIRRLNSRPEGVPAARVRLAEARAELEELLPESALSEDFLSESAPSAAASAEDLDEVYALAGVGISR